MGYCEGLHIQEPENETLDSINNTVAAFFNESLSSTEKSFSKAEVKAYCFHEVALVGRSCASRRHPEVSPPMIAERLTITPKLCGFG